MPKPRIKPGAEMVAAEIKTLRNVRGRVVDLPEEKFPFKRLIALEAQLDVLADGLDEDEVRETFGEDRTALPAALAAFRWLNGEMDAPKPSAAYTDL